MIDEERTAYEHALREQESQASQARTQNYQNEMMLQGQDKSMISEQLDLGEDLERIDYLLEKHEIFARAYAQYIATKSKDILMKAQLEYRRRFAASAA